MASVCPNCGKKLHFYNVKADCSQCGVSIPNFNWEKRLEEDNANAEKSSSPSTDSATDLLTLFGVQS